MVDRPGRGLDLRVKLPRKTLWWVPPGRRVYPSSSSSSSSSIGSLSKDVFEGRTSTGSEPFSLFICLDANKFVLLSFFSLIKTIYQRVSTKPLPHDAKSPLPVDVCRSKTPSLKLPIIRELKQQRCWATDVNRKWTFCIIGPWLVWNSLVNRLYKRKET